VARKERKERRAVVKRNLVKLKVIRLVIKRKRRSNPKI